MHRHPNPPTSQAAAATVPRLTHRQAVTRIMAWINEPLTAVQIEWILQDRCSPSSVRGRLSELAEAGLNVGVGERANRSGCQARL